MYMAELEATSLLIISGGAFLIPLIAGRIGIPVAVAEIIFGLLISRWIKVGELIEFLSILGFALLMFIAGMEIDFKRVEEEGKEGLLFSTLICSMFFILSYVLCRYLFLDVFYTLVLGATSTGMVIAALRETGKTRTELGQTLILMSSIGEIMTLVLMTAFSIYEKTSLSVEFFVEIGTLFTIFVVAYLVLFLLKSAVWWYPKQFSKIIAGDPSEVGVRIGLALMFAFIAISVKLRVEMILGAFIAGAIFSFVFREKGPLEEKFSSIGYGFFIPVFFINVGISFEPVFSVELLKFLSKLLVLVLLVKLIPSLLLSSKGITIRESFSSGFILSAPLTLLIAIASLGTEIGAITQEESSAIVLLAMASGLLYPTVFKLLESGDNVTA